MRETPEEILPSPAQADDAVPRSPSDLHRVRGAQFVAVWVAAMLGVAVLMLPGLGDANRTLTAHEVFAAQPAKQMLDGEGWIIMRFVDQPRMQKPPTISWVMAGSMAVFGENAFAARLPSVLAVMVLAGTLGMMGVCGFGRTVGLMTALITPATVFVIIQGRLAEADMAMCAAVAGAIFAYMRAIERETPRRGWTMDRWQGLMFIAAGAAFLLKPPVGLAFVALTVGCHALWLAGVHRSGAGFGTLKSLPGIVLLLFMIVGWPIAAMISNPAVIDMWRGQVGGRFTGETGSDPWWYYLREVPWLTLPWVIFAVGAALGCMRQREAGGARHLCSLLGLWFITAFVMLSMVTDKHKHYIMPALGPIVLLGAVGLVGHVRRRCHTGQPQWKFAILVWAIVAAAGVTATLLIESIVGMFGESITVTPTMRSLMLAIIVVLAAGMIGVVLAEKYRSFIGQAAGWLATFYLIFGLWLHLGVPQFDSYRANAEFAHRVNRLAEEYADRPRLTFVGLGQAQITFYITDEYFASMHRKSSLESLEPQSADWLLIEQHHWQQRPASLHGRPLATQSKPRSSHDHARRLLLVELAAPQASEPRP